MHTPPTDVIDHLAGIAPGSRLDAVRRQRIEARTHAQASYDSLFTPVAEAGFPRAERRAVAAFVALLHNQPDCAAHYTAPLDADTLRAIRAEAARAQATGPFGNYPQGPLSAENRPGKLFRADPALLGPHLAAALTHTHMLLFHPRDAAPAHLQALVDAGWSTPAIVTLSQLVAFLSFQIRVVAGFRAMAQVQ